jgi:predicted deacylase
MKMLILAALLLSTAASATAERVEQPDAHPSFTVGTATAQRGQRAYGVLKVPAGSDAGYDIPVAVVHGAKPGPVLAIVSGAHGTEYASIIAVQQLIDAVKPADLSGTLILVPLVNVPSFEKLTPHVNPTDNKSMNSRYPGDLSGTQTDRASAVITKEVVEQCDHLIDLHGGDLDENLRPYSYWTVTGNQKQDQESRAMLLAFGLDHIIIWHDRPTDPAATRYLDNTASVRGKPSIVVEAGHAGTVDSDDLSLLVNGTLSTMRALKMLPGAPHPIENPVWIEKLVDVLADGPGIWYPLVKRGTYVSAGMKLGTITDYVGKVIAEPRAPVSAIVLHVNAVPSLKKGDNIADLGVPAAQAP